MSLVQFHTSLKSILGRAGHSQQQLAAALDLHSTVLSNKLLGVRKGRLTNLDIKNIIKTLAEWEAIFSQKEALELLACLDLTPTFFSKEEWTAFPLNRLENLPASPDSLPGESFKPAEVGKPSKILPTSKSKKSAQVSPAAASNTELSYNQQDEPPSTVPNQSRLSPMTRLIGREELLGELGQVLCQPQVRLISLIGPGGIGKTRMAQAVAKHQPVSPRFRDGEYFVELDKLTSAELVLRTIADTLALKDRLDSTSALELLGSYLSDKEVLIILDNFEHVTEAAPHLAELLAAAPGLKLLVTSRVTLGIYGEWEFIVPPLPLPVFKPHEQIPGESQSSGGQTETAVLAGLAHNPSLALFIERARAIDHRLSLTRHNVKTLVKICQLLEGFPLALELAAARTRLFGLDSLLTHLQNSYLQVLNHGQVKLRQERHRSLQASLDWSYNLLSRDEQKLFCRLAFFIDGFNIETVRAILPPDETASKTELGLYEGLENLLNKSILTEQESEGDLPPRRYRMLQPIREYALERLKDWQDEFLQEKTEELGKISADERDWQFREDYNRFWVEWVNKEVENLETTGNPASFRRVRREYANIREVLELALKHRAVEIALSLVDSLSFYWNWQANFNEWLSYLDPVLALDFQPFATNPVLLRLRGKLLFWSGFLAIAQLDIARTRQRIQESLQIFRALNDKTWIARNLNCLGFVESSAGNTGQGLRYFYESLEIRREDGNLVAVAHGLGNLGVGLINNNDDAAALVALQEGYEIFAANGYELGLATVLSKEISYVALHRGDLALTRRYLDDGLDIAHKINNEEALHYGRTMYGVVYYFEANPCEALASLKAGLEIAHRIGDNFGILHNLAVYPVVLTKLSLAKKEGGGFYEDEKDLLLKAARLLAYLESLLKEKGIVLPPMFRDLMETARAEIWNQKAGELTQDSQARPLTSLKETIDWVLQDF